MHGPGTHVISCFVVMNANAVSLTGPAKSFGAVRAVTGLTLEIPQGQTVALSRCPAAIEAAAPARHNGRL
ncbi:hypothetical protein GCM10022226_81110 [Sphaerisporangium flaviroseum]|uniref:Uncharacterized protein n=2 Tax=Sphaerisporangium flaviroseum TaxID=509199 RepID=A0ABP7JI36_9ACTN